MTSIASFGSDYSRLLVDEDELIVAQADLHEFDTGAVRSKDVDDVRWDLISPVAMKALANYCSDFIQDHQFPSLDNALDSIYNFLGGDHDETLCEATMHILQSIDLIKCGKIKCDNSSNDLHGPKFSWMPYEGLRSVAAAYAEGAEKYDEFNWEKGMDLPSLLNHCIAHIFKWFSGDRSEDHLGHAGWNAMAAIHSLEMWPELNKGKLRQPGCKPPA